MRENFSRQEPEGRRGSDRFNLLELRSLCEHRVLGESLLPEGMGTFPASGAKRQLGKQEFQNTREDQESESRDQHRVMTIRPLALAIVILRTQPALE